MDSWIARTAGIALFGVAAIVQFSGCSFGTVQARWTEDVQLSSGRVVQIERDETYETTRPLGSGTDYLMIAARLRLLNEEPMQTGEWTQPLSALLFDQDARTGEYVIVGAAPTCAIYNQLGRPDPVYLEYRWRDGAWQSVALSDFSIDRVANLLVRIRPEAEKGHVTLDDKRRRDLPALTYRLFRRIDPQMRMPC